MEYFGVRGRREGYTAMSNLGKKLRLHHIGIVARDEAQIEEFKRIMGLEEEARGTIENTTSPTYS